MGFIFAPFKWLLRFLGFLPEEDLELKYRVTIAPIPGVSAKDLIATGKKIWPNDKGSVPLLINSWISNVKEGNWWDAGKTFILEGCTKEQVSHVVKICREGNHFKVIRNEYEEMKGRAATEARKILHKRNIEKLAHELIAEQSESGDLEKYWEQHQERSTG